MKCEDRSHEETERQERCARGIAWNLARNIYKLQEKDKATFYSPSEKWIVPAASTIKPEEREFVADSGASMHMVSKRDLNSAEVETVRISKNPTTVMTANGEVQTREELCEDHGYTNHRTSGQKPLLTNNGKRINCNVANYVPFVYLLRQHLHRRILWSARKNPATEKVKL